MRDMNEKEIKQLIEEWTWGTLIAVDDNKPYAIENTYGSDGKYIYCGSMPGGRMARCIKKNPNVVYKICNAEKDYREWKAVIVEGKAERLTKKEDMLYAMRLISKKRGLPENHYDSIADLMVSKPEEANCIRILIQNIGGRSSS
jgi:nitroimidazol reductase NimA-like FMN-containing flavoprotein (pyridoxamine 5'-phosphate oxidase superfamily)